jgi:hypothetical protein
MPNDTTRLPVVPIPDEGRLPGELMGTSRMWMAALTAFEKGDDAALGAHLRDIVTGRKAAALRAGHKACDAEYIALPDAKPESVPVDLILLIADALDPKGADRPPSRVMRSGQNGPGAPEKGLANLARHHQVGEFVHDLTERGAKYEMAVRDAMAKFGLGKNRVEDDTRLYRQIMGVTPKRGRGALRYL